MPFQMRDETAGQNILYIDNSGNAGLGGLPNSGQSLSVAGVSTIASTGNFAGAVASLGSLIGLTGSIAVPPTSSASVSIAVTQAPTVTTSQPSTSVSTTSVQWANTGSTTLTVTYSLW